MTPSIVFLDAEEMKPLDRGTYGDVDLVRVPSGEIPAPGVLLVRKSSHLEYSAFIWKEIRILNEFRNCQRIVKYYGDEFRYRKEDKSWVHDVYLEYADGGTLSDVIRRAGGRIVDVDHIRAYARMILEGLDCIHQKGYVHCDLKPENILAFSGDFDFTEIQFPWELKLADFGLAKEPREETNEESPTWTPKSPLIKTLSYQPTWRTSSLFLEMPPYQPKWNPMNLLIGLPTWTAKWPFIETPPYKQTESPNHPFIKTLSYLSPESLMGTIGPDMDTWAVGCVVYEMLTGKTLWEDVDSEETRMELVLGDETPEMPEDLSDVGKEFLKLCLERDHIYRPTAWELLSHPWILD